jgi:hypothetical protein
MAITSSVTFNLMKKRKSLRERCSASPFRLFSAERYLVRRVYLLG